MLRKIALGLVIVLVAAQFYRPARNLSAGPGPNDITAKHPVPANVQAILDRACMDCHSNNTRYPWYAEVQPVRWWLDRHIVDGKRHLNFSEYGAYNLKRATRKAEEIGSEVKEHKMPLPSYTWVHPEARLTSDEMRLLADWSVKLRAEVVAAAPKS
jgi:hypothetical protein